VKSARISRISDGFRIALVSAARLFSSTEKNNLKVTPSTGNVFRDLGFSAEEAEHLLIRADLPIQLQKAIASRGLTQAKAAKILRVTQPRVSDLLRGRIDLFSTDSLIDHAGAPWCARALCGEVFAPSTESCLAAATRRPQSRNITIPDT